MCSLQTTGTTRTKSSLLQFQILPLWQDLLGLPPRQTVLDSTRTRGNHDHDTVRDPWQKQELAAQVATMRRGRHQTMLRAPVP